MPRVPLPVALAALALVFAGLVAGVLRLAPYLGAPSGLSPEEQATLVMRWYDTGCEDFSLAVPGDGELEVTCADGARWNLYEEVPCVHGPLCAMGVFWTACWRAPMAVPPT
jgi:hypothetical protein